MDQRLRRLLHGLRLRAQLRRVRSHRQLFSMYRERLRRVVPQRALEGASRGGHPAQRRHAAEQQWCVQLQPRLVHHARGRAVARRLAAGARNGSVRSCLARVAMGARGSARSIQVGHGSLHERLMCLVYEKPPGPSPAPAARPGAPIVLPGAWTQARGRRGAPPPAPQRQPPRRPRQAHSAPAGPHAAARPRTPPRLAAPPCPPRVKTVHRLGCSCSGPWLARRTSRAAGRNRSTAPHVRTSRTADTTCD